MTSDPDRVRAFLKGALGDPGAGWSLGTFGAIAEFMRDPDEACTRSDIGLGVSTARGAIRFDPAPGLVPVAYETALGGGWNHAVALCLPEPACAMSGRRVVTELGPDAAALRAQDRDGILFDLGLGLLQVDVCLRARDPETIAWLRSGVGLAPFDPANPIGPRLSAMSPHRVFVARCGRIEVFQPIPPPDGTSPEGPHTHVVPRLLRAGRTHAATAPIPKGLVPCAHLHPPHPCKDMTGARIPFDRARHDAFQDLYAAWGDPRHVALKARLLTGGEAPPGRLDRHARMVAKVAAAQTARLSDSFGAPRATG